MKNKHLFGINAAGLKSKMDSLQNRVKQLKPGVIMIQETKVYHEGTLELENYDAFELTRKSKEGGGLAIYTHHSLEGVLISEFKHKLGV